MIASNFNNVQPGLRGDWTEVEGNWILRPLQGAAIAVVHFLGGAFVGAAPQLTYRLLLESLAARGVMVSMPFVIVRYQLMLCLNCTHTMCLTHCRCCVVIASFCCCCWWWQITLHKQPCSHCPSLHCEVHFVLLCR